MTMAALSPAYSTRRCCSVKLLQRQYNGAVAQLGEHLLCKQGVTGSIPVRSMWQ
jgi:hypothetical protein